MSKKLLVLTLALFMIAGLHSKVKAETAMNQANSQITIHVENKGSFSSSSNPSNSESQKNKKTPTGKLPLTNAQRQTGLGIVGLLLLLGSTCVLIKRKRGREHE